MKAIWKGAVLAESDKTVLVEGNHYFPPESVRREEGLTLQRKFLFDILAKASIASTLEAWLLGRRCRHTRMQNSAGLSFDFVWEIH
ncbi:MAG: DUF427 domain-containing protein [Candidatus Binatia bacterium]